MDIQHLVDRLEDLIDEGRHIFGTKYTLIDEERALELIDQMRISIPEEIEKAQRILSERERIRAEAHEEAAHILEEQRRKAESLIDEEQMVQAARRRAESIKEQARKEAERITREADQYVIDLLGRLESQLQRDLSEVRNGIQVLQQENTQPQYFDPSDQPLFMPGQSMRDDDDINESVSVELPEMVDIDAASDGYSSYADYAPDDNNGR